MPISWGMKKGQPCGSTINLNHLPEPNGRFLSLWEKQGKDSKEWENGYDFISMAGNQELGFFFKIKHLRNTADLQWQLLTSWSRYTMCSTCLQMTYWLCSPHPLQVLTPPLNPCNFDHSAVYKNMPQHYSKTVFAFPVLIRYSLGKDYMLITSI